MAINKRITSPLWFNLNSLSKQVNCHKIKISINTLWEAIVVSIICYKQAGFDISVLLLPISYITDKQTITFVFESVSNSDNDTLTIGFQSFCKMARQYNHRCQRSSLTKSIENNLNNSTNNLLLQLMLEIVILLSNILINIISLGLIMTSPKMDYNHLWVGLVTYILLLEMKNIMYRKTAVRSTVINGVPYMSERFEYSAFSWIMQYLGIDLAIFILLWFDFNSKFILLLNWHFYITYGLIFLFGSLLINGLKLFININFINN